MNKEVTQIRLGSSTSQNDNYFIQIFFASVTGSDAASVAYRARTELTKI